MSRPDYIDVKIDVTDSMIRTFEDTGGVALTGHIEVPLRQPSARAQERARVAAVMAAPSPKRERSRKSRRENLREYKRGNLYRPRGFYGETLGDAFNGFTYSRELAERTGAIRLPTGSYAPRPADGPPAFRRACLRGLGRFLTGPSAAQRLARKGWRDFVTQTISEASS